MVVGVLLLLVGEAVDGPTDSFVELVPWNEFGGILIGAGILGIWIDHLFKRDQQAASEQLLRSVLADHAPVMRDAVISAFAADQSDLARIATPETLDQIITNSLGLRLNNNDFATQIYRDLKQQTVEVAERWHDASVDITVVPHSDAEGYFSVVARWEYTVIPKYATRQFVCVGDRDEYAEMARSNTGESAWFRPNDHFAASDPEAFELVSFTIDGQTLPIRRSQRSSSQSYRVALSAEMLEADKPVNVVYTTRTATRAAGHLLFFDIEQPTNGITISFDYTATDIATISTVDLFQSPNPSRIEHSPEGIGSRVIRVAVDGWIFPRSGVAFVWNLDPERGQLTDSKLTKSGPANKARRKRKTSQ